MTLKSLIGAVKTVSLTQDIKRSVKISFNSAPSGIQYQELLMDLISFLQENIPSGITKREIGNRSAHDLPDYEFRRNTRPTDGYQMKADYKAVRINPLSIIDEKELVIYAAHLRRELDIID